METWCLVAILVIAIVLGIILYRRVKKRCSIQLAASVDVSFDTWAELEEKASRLLPSIRNRVTFTLSKIAIKDQLVHTKKEFEKILHHTVEWATQHHNISIPSYRIKWRRGDSPTMEYFNNTLTISMSVLGRFTDADIVLATLHEIIGHHHQENTSQKNTRTQQESCGLACEDYAYELSPSLRNRWRLMRVVRGLIDLRMNDERFKDKPSPKDIYDKYNVRMMTLKSIVDQVSRAPGEGLKYFGKDVGKGCACSFNPRLI